MKRNVLCGWGLLLLGFFLGIAATLILNRNVKPNENKSGTVKTDQPTLDRITHVTHELQASVITNTLVVQEIRETVADCSNFITALPVLKYSGFDNVRFSIYKNDYELPLKLPRLLVGAGYGYPSGLQVTAGYRVTSGVMLLANISKSGGSLSAALFLL